ncbi:hypothetical protein BU204_18860 [Actinophytocola xanthii]|uniref:GAF domain-containing protein n=1 Tax=Actinophytocola xanthii TaxID=1912961 RepID=A0A1Q8CNS2_9PSEU|nr:hypothetical protein BU204_18860 [Actinophytocola xanthii]
MCEVAIECLDVDAVAISARGTHGTRELAAATDGWATRAAELEATAGEGPGHDALILGGEVSAPDLDEARHRWPRYRALAGELGVAAVFAWPVPDGTGAPALLTGFRRQPGALPYQERVDAAALIALAAKALRYDRERAGRAGGEANKE